LNIITTTLAAFICIRLALTDPKQTSNRKVQLPAISLRLRMQSLIVFLIMVHEAGRQMSANPGNNSKLSSSTMMATSSL
jgi:hypothetical protein